MSTGDNIKKCRKMRGMTQKELGDLLGIKQATVSAFEKDKTNIKYSTLEKIAIALKVSVTELLNYDDYSSYFNTFQHRNKPFLDGFEKMLYSKDFIICFLENDPEHAILQHRFVQNMHYLVNVDDYSKFLSSIEDYFHFKLDGFIKNSTELTKDEYELLKIDIAKTPSL